MQKIRPLVFVATSVYLLASSAHAAPPVDGGAGLNTSWLLIQTAKGARFDGRTLTLTHVSPSVTMFTDRPQRRARTIPLNTFAHDWSKGGQNSLKTDHPNAGVTSVVNGNLETTTVELSKPRLAGTTLTYDVKVLQGTLPARSGETSIFIDDIPWNPGGF